MVFSGSPKERELLKEELARLTIRCSWADSRLRTVKTLREWRTVLEEQQELDAFVCDVAQKGAIDLLKETRKRFPGMLTVPIADLSVPPTEYVQPDIMPYTLFWRPLSAQSIEKGLFDVLSHICVGKRPPTQDQFKVETRQKTQYIPYEEIFYFEAYDKKVYLHLRHSELTLRTTLNQLEQQLQGSFLRCHKSYLVNRAHVLSVNWKEHLVQMDAEQSLPLSKSYRKQFREVYGEDGG